MRPGKLRHRVTIQKIESVRKPGGTYEPQPVDVATVWANIIPKRGTERYQAQQIESELSHTIVLRYRSDVTPQMKIKYGDRLFDIESVINVGERNRKMEIEAIEVVA
jgi:SPP1 family predicted phage head-tail adaptor